jgi:hypothetical protein
MAAAHIFQPSARGCDPSAFLPTLTPSGPAEDLAEVTAMLEHVAGAPARSVGGLWWRDDGGGQVRPCNRGPSRLGTREPCSQRGEPGRGAVRVGARHTC